MTVEFRQATLEGSYLRMALIGPSGSGKTLTALKLAKVLTNNGRVCVIDTEDDSAKLFVNNSDVPKPYHVVNLTDPRPSLYDEYIQSAAEQGFDTCIIDSATPSWHKILDAVGGNVLRWKDVGNPAYEKLLSAFKGYRDRMHIIVTFRSKMELTLEKDDATNKLVVTKHGLQPIHRDTMPYEFDIVGQLDENHVLSFTGIGKQRCEVLDGRTFTKPGLELGLILKDWLKGTQHVDS